MVFRLGLCMVMALAIIAPWSMAQIRSIGIAGDGEHTRVTLVSEREIETEVLLSMDAAGPVFEWLSSGFSISPQAYIGDPTGGISSYTLGVDGIRFNLDRPMMVVRELNLPPTRTEPTYRYIVDLSSVSLARFQRAEQYAVRDGARPAASIRSAMAPMPAENAEILLSEPVATANLQPDPVGVAGPAGISGETDAYAARIDIAVSPSLKPDHVGPLQTIAEVPSTPALQPEPMTVVFAGIGNAPPPSLKPGYRPAPLPPRIPMIVIDAGHGGRDPGAIAVNGRYEKDIVLQTALHLGRLLEADERYDVRLTREDDRYIEHEDRVSSARDWGGDLFISIHADAAANSDVTGASVYTISSRGERRIEGTAMQNGWEIPLETGAPSEVNDILEDLVLRETKSNSAIFAELLVPELAKAGPLVRNSHRQGNLFVLLAPDVPAVLVEIGFLTNASDAARLSSQTGREKSAEAIKRSIDAYFDRQKILLASN